MTQLGSLVFRTYKSLLLIVIAAAALLPVEACAQLPKRIHIVVPFPPGGPVDISARVLAESMQAQTGIPVIIDNRPGANGSIAAIAVKQAAPDGGTLLFATSGMLTINPHLYSNLPYDAAVDFVPISTATYSDAALVVPGNLPVRNLKEFVELAKITRPPFTFGSAGTGSITHLYIELFKDAAKIELLHVPYKGIADAFTGVLGGHVTGVFVAFATALPQIRAGKVKVLGLVGTKRSALAPEVPTLEEQGYKGINLMTWTSVMAPHGIRAEIAKAIETAVSNALAPEAVKAKLRAGGLTAWVLPADEFARTIKSESDQWKKLIADKNIKAE